jgi:hypothetical protein
LWTKSSSATYRPGAALGQSALAVGERLNKYGLRGPAGRIIMY